MELKDLTPEIVTPVLEHILAEFGEDFVYRQGIDNVNGYLECKYNKPDGSPDCIVGHVMSRLGIDTSDWDDVDVYDGDTSFDNICMANDVTFDGVTRALGRAQFKQDIGTPWGGAVQAYRDSLAANVRSRHDNVSMSGL